MTHVPNFETKAAQQVHRLHSTAIEEGSPEAMADFGASRLVARAGNCGRAWLVVRHDRNDDSELIIRYLSEADGMGNRTWVSLPHADRFTSFRAAHAASALVGEGVVMPFRLLGSTERHLEPTGLTL